MSDEKTPSFSLDPAQQRWFCFSTGQGGGLPQFIQRFMKCGFHQAVKIMQDYAGISDVSIGSVKRLQASQIARRYGATRRRKPEPSPEKLPSDIMERYEWDPEKLQPWVDEGITLETMRAFDVRYDPFSQRIVMPIRDIYGNIINVHGRTVITQFKEKRVRKYTFFYAQGSVNTIYGVWENREAIRKSNTLLLVEGEKSVMKLWQWGYRNAGALLTSHLSEHQFKILVRLGLRRVVFCLDADVDVRADREIQKLRQYTQVEWVHNWHDLLQSKEAPVDRGLEVWETLYERRWKL